MIFEENLDKVLYQVKICFKAKMINNITKNILRTFLKIFTSLKTVSSKNTTNRTKMIKYVIGIKSIHEKKSFKFSLYIPQEFFVSFANVIFENKETMSDIERPKDPNNFVFFL